MRDMHLRFFLFEGKRGHTTKFDKVNAIYGLIVTVGGNIRTVLAFICWIPVNEYR